MEILVFLANAFQSTYFLSIIKALLFLAIGFFGGRFVSSGLVKIIKNKTNAHTQLIVKKKYFTLSSAY
ncbi:MAG: hypothetical protein ACI82Z_000131 [Cellvibrionaceae bacterium]|jgi:hypothetical protein